MIPEPALRLSDLDPVIHAPKRLAVMAILDNSTSGLRVPPPLLDVSDSDLSKQMSALERAGYVATRRPAGRGTTVASPTTAAPSAASLPSGAPLD